MQNQTYDLEQLRQALILAKDTKWEDGEELAYTIFSQAKNAMSIIVDNNLHELRYEVFGLLKCDNELIREEAIACLCFTTRLRLTEFKDAAYELFINDKSDFVKSTALASWCAFYLETKDKDVLSTLYKILKDDNYNSSIRAQAHTSLFNTVDTQYPGHDRMKSFDALLNSNTAEEFNRTVDWDAVNKLMKKYAPEELSD